MKELWTDPKANQTVTPAVSSQSILVVVVVVVVAAVAVPVAAAVAVQVVPAVVYSVVSRAAAARNPQTRTRHPRP